MSHKIMKQIQEKFAQIASIWPNPSYMCVLKPNGEILTSQETKSKALSEDLLDPISSLRKTAIQFGSILGQKECQVIHIRGRRAHEFCAYSIGTNLLCFYSKMASIEEARKFNVQKADMEMEPILHDLQLLLQGVGLIPMAPHHAVAPVAAPSVASSVTSSSPLLEGRKAPAADHPAGDPAVTPPKNVKGGRKLSK
jgi:hypothetical protein